MKKTIFKINGNFFRKVKIPVKYPIPQISEDLLILKFVQENFMAKKYDFTFFSSKIYVQLPRGPNN